MHLEQLQITNYRSILNMTLEFAEGYTAISGRNDAGKSSVFEAIKVLIGRERDRWMLTRGTLDFGKDYPRWLVRSAESFIEIAGTFKLTPEREINLRNFCTKQLSLVNSDFGRITIKVRLNSGSAEPLVTVQVDDLNIVDGQNAAEVWRKIKQDNALIIHNSTTDSFRLGFGDTHGEFSQLTDAISQVQQSIKQDFKGRLKKITSTSQISLQDMFSKLSDNLKVSIEVADFQTFVPFNLALGDVDSSVSLEAWGSGTKNKSLIILAIMRALQVSKSAGFEDKIVPLLIIEEPESFLHPAAQAELGSFLIQQSEQNHVQILSATHSAYMLNTSSSKGNILLDRNVNRRKLRDTIQMISDDTNWMVPFSKVLGLSEDSLKPWREVISSRDKKVLLVEGETDQGYLSALQSPIHGNNALDSDITIIPYGGTGQLNNQSVLKMVLRLADRVVITYDMDAAERVEKTLETIQLRRGLDFFPIGSSKPSGIKSIEGLVPASIKNAVTTESPELFQIAAGTDAEAKSAKSEIKKRYLDKFTSTISTELELKDFYHLSAQLNKALKAPPAAFC